MKSPFQSNYDGANVTITGGTIDATNIGATTPGTGAFTTFTSTGIDDNATSVVVTIDASENVGIGTTAPSGKLHLASSAASNNFYIDTYSTGAETNGIVLRKSDTSVIGNTATTDDGDVLGTIGFQGVDSGSNFDLGALITATQNGAAGATLPTDLKFETYSDSALNSSQLVLANSGNVGIGTAAPATLLHVAGGSGSGAVSFTKDSIGNNGTDGLWIGYSNAAYIHNYEATNLVFATNNTTQMVIDTSGNVLPGTTEAQDIGSVTKEWDNAFLQNAVTVSDERRKENIQTIINASAFLREIDPVWFNYKSKVIPAETTTVEKQVTVTKQRQETGIEIRNGKPIQTVKTVDYEEPQFEDAAVMDEAGAPVMKEVQVADGKTEMVPLTHRMPIMETVTETKAAQTISHTRPHTGFIAQKIKAAMTAAGYADWAGYSYDDESDTHMLRLMEMVSFLAKGWQEVDARLAALETGTA